MERKAQRVGIDAATEKDSAVSLRVSVTKSTAWTVDGFKAALERYRKAEQEGSADAVSHALAEIVMWLDSLATQHPSLLGDATVRAMTFARARSHHHLASVIELPEKASKWQWRRASLFPSDPKYPDERGERVYQSVLEGKHVGATLTAAERAVARL